MTTSAAMPAASAFTADKTGAAVKNNITEATSEQSGFRGELSERLTKGNENIERTERTDFSEKTESGKIGTEVTRQLRRDLEDELQKKAAVSIGKEMAASIPVNTEIDEICRNSMANTNPEADLEKVTTSDLKQLSLAHSNTDMIPKTVERFLSEHAEQFADETEAPELNSFADVMIPGNAEKQPVKLSEEISENQTDFKKGVEIDINPEISAITQTVAASSQNTENVTAENTVTATVTSAEMTSVQSTIEQAATNAAEIADASGMTEGTVFNDEENIEFRVVKNDERTSVKEADEKELSEKTSSDNSSETIADNEPIIKAGGMLRNVTKADSEIKEISQSAYGKEKSNAPAEKEVQGRNEQAENGISRPLQQSAGEVRAEVNQTENKQPTFTRMTVDEVYSYVTESAKTTTGRQNFTFELNPETLGKITVRLINEGGKLSVEILTETKAAKELFEARGEQLAQSLKQSDVDVQSYKVEQSTNEMFNESFEGSSKNPYKQGEDNSGDNDTENGGFDGIISEMLKMDQS